MKLIRTDSRLLSFSSGNNLKISECTLGGEEDSIVLLQGEVEFYIFSRQYSQQVFEALIQFLAGREVLFDVDKFVAQLERREGSKL